MPSEAQLIEHLTELLQPFSKDGSPVTAETLLVEDLGLDSVQIMELLLDVEDRYDVSIPLNILPEVRTVADLARQLQGLIQ